MPAKPRSTSIFPLRTVERSRPSMLYKLTISPLVFIYAYYRGYAIIIFSNFKYSLLFLKQMFSQTLVERQEYMIRRVIDRWWDPTDGEFVKIRGNPCRSVKTGRFGSNGEEIRKSVRIEHDESRPSWHHVYRPKMEQLKPGYVRVKWFHSMEVMWKDDSCICSDLPMQADGSLDLRPFAKRWGLRNVVPVDCSRMGIFEPARESMKLSAVAVRCLTGEDFCLRVVEISPDGVFDGRNARISIWEDYEYRRRLYLARRHGHLKSLPYTLFYMVWQLTKWLFNLFVTTPCRIRCSVAKETYRGMEETVWGYAGPFITGYLRGRFYWRGIISVCSYVVYSLVTLVCLVWCIVVVAPRPLWDALFLFQAGRYSWLGGSKALPIALEFLKSGTEEMTNMFLLLCFGIVLSIGFGLLRWGVAGMIMSIGVLVTAGMMSSVVVGEGVGRLPLQMMRMVI